MINQSNEILSIPTIQESTVSKPYLTIMVLWTLFAGTTGQLSDVRVIIDARLEKDEYFFRVHRILSYKNWFLIFHRLEIACLRFGSVSEEN